MRTPALGIIVIALAAQRDIKTWVELTLASEPPAANWKLEAGNW